MTAKHQPREIHTTSVAVIDVIIENSTLNDVLDTFTKEFEKHANHHHFNGRIFGLLKDEPKISFNWDFEQTDSYSLQKGKEKEDVVKKDQIKPLRQLNEISGMIQNPQYKQSAELSQGIQQLHHLSGVLQNESVDYPYDLPTSFASAETQIAKYISECLEDSHEENSNIEKILSLVKDYKVVRLLPEEKHTVSLHKVHLILQDNYPDSSLCGLFNLLLCGRNNGTPKVITFY